MWADAMRVLLRATQKGHCVGGLQCEVFLEVFIGKK